MTLPLANVQTTDTFQTWLTRTNQVIDSAANTNVFAGSITSRHGSSGTPITFNVVVQSKVNHPYQGVGSGSAYFIDGVESPAIDFKGVDPSYPTYYKFDQSDSSNGSHTLRFYKDAAKTQPFTTGVTVAGTAGNAGSSTTIAVDNDTPSVLYYQCENHGYMGHYASTDGGTVDSVRFVANTASVSHEAGKLFYDAGNQSLSFFNDESDITLQVGQEQYIRVYNATGSQINNGIPVYVSGDQSGVPQVSPADASGADTLYAIGLATHNIDNAEYGYVTVQGVVNDINTSSLSIGGAVHVAPGGGLQAAAPTHPNYAHEIGFCLASDATSGSIYVNITEHYFEQLRVGNDVRVEGNFLVEGNFEVLGAETVTTLTNLQVDDTFVYLNAGDTVASNTAAVTGLNDVSFKGHYTGGNTVTYYVKVDSTGGGAADKFSWSFDNFSSTRAANVAITGADQSLAHGISIRFTANTGHTAGDIWTGVAAPLNLDTGWSSNRNSGHAAGGYTHLGMYHDVTDSRFRLFQSYAPEPAGNIDPNHASFEYGNLQANTFYGSFIGDGSGLTNAGSTVAVKSDNVDYKVTFTNQLDGAFANTFVDSALVYNPSTDKLVVPNIQAGTKLGIGTTTTPDGLLHVKDTQASVGLTDPMVRVERFTSGDNHYLDITVNNSTNMIGFQSSGSSDGGFHFGGATSNTVVIAAGGDVTITGQVSAPNFNSTSDVRLKENIQPIEGALDKVMGLAGVEFDWIESSEHTIGVIAQQVEEVLPELVHTNEEGYKSVSYGNLTALLIEAVKELKTIVDNK